VSERVVRHVPTSSPPMFQSIHACRARALESAPLKLSSLGGDSGSEEAVLAVDDGGKGHGHRHAAPHGGDRRLLLRAWIFFLALSFHGVMDGLSVGSEDGEKGFTSILVAVLSHKLFDGLSLGCALFPAGLPRSHRWALLIVCAATTPIGIGIGIAATAAVTGQQAKLVNGLVLGMVSVFLPMM